MPKREYPFEPIMIKSYQIKREADIVYRIYKSDKEFTDCVASSVQDAILESKIESPIKIQVLIPKKKIYLEDDELEPINSQIE